MHIHFSIFYFFFIPSCLIRSDAQTDLKRQVGWISGRNQQQPGVHGMFEESVISINQPYMVITTEARIRTRERGSAVLPCLRTCLCSHAPAIDNPTPQENGCAFITLSLPQFYIFSFTVFSFSVLSINGVSVSVSVCQIWKVQALVQFANNPFVTPRHISKPSFPYLAIF